MAITWFDEEIDEIERQILLQNRKMDESIECEKNEEKMEKRVRARRRGRFKRWKEEKWAANKKDTINIQHTHTYNHTHRRMDGCIDR